MRIPDPYEDYKRFPKKSYINPMVRVPSTRYIGFYPIEFLYFLDFPGFSYKITINRQKQSVHSFYLSGGVS